MASWKEIERYRKSPEAVHRLAAILLEDHRDELTDWETNFLESMRQWEGELTTRQSESLLSIRDGLIWVKQTREGFSVSLLLKQCYEARIDLSEADEEWVVAAYAQRERGIRAKYVGRLLRCARALHIIDVDDEAA